METWMDELEKAVRRAPELDEEQDGEGEDEDCEEMEKAVGGKYAPAANGDDDNSEGADVADGDAMEGANQNPGKKQKLYPKNKGGVKKSLGAEDAAAIDASEVLEGLCKSIDNLATGKDAELASLRAEVASLTKGLEVIGKALVKSLETSNDIAKSLSGQMDQMGRQPAARKSTVRKIEKSFGGENERTEFPNKQSRMEKSLAGVKEGKISPVEASIFESACNRGEFRTDLWKKMGGE